MNVTNLKLSKQLYELSGWNETEKCWLNDKGGGGTKTLEFVGDWSTPNTPDWYVELAPAYDLGYLLRKLPLNSLIHRNNNGQYQAVHDIYNCFADTPEDAAALLCIELIESGVLTKGEE